MKHDWFTHADSREWCDAGDPAWNAQPDAFRLDSGYHNGPQCKRCGRIACEHCEPGIWDEECPG